MDSLLPVVKYTRFEVNGVRDHCSYGTVLFVLQQAFNATAVVRHMRRLQLGTSHEGPNPNLPSPCRTHLLMPEEDAGAGYTFFYISLSLCFSFNSTLNTGTWLLSYLSRTSLRQLQSWWHALSFSLAEACCEGGCSQNVDGGAEPLSNCTYRCHPTSRVWYLLLLRLPV